MRYISVYYFLLINFSNSGLVFFNSTPGARETREDKLPGGTVSCCVVVRKPPEPVRIGSPVPETITLDGTPVTSGSSLNKSKYFLRSSKPFKPPFTARVTPSVLLQSPFESFFTFLSLFFYYYFKVFIIIVIFIVINILIIFFFIFKFYF